MNSSICKLKALSFAVLFGLTACGGGGGSSTPATTTATGTSSGIFLDAEVSGLSYTTSSGVSGTTDSNGTYTYSPGDTITFNVGGVSLGSVAGAPKCTPVDFGAASTNIARFIQSLDKDGDPTNGIDISDAATALAGVTIDGSAFASPTLDPAISTAITTAGGADVGEATALANLAAGTSTTFDTTEIGGAAGTPFVTIDPTNNDIGVLSFDIAAAGTAFDISSSDTTAAGSDGLGTDLTWAIDASGVLTLTDISDSSKTTINRVGGSSRSISVTYTDDTGVTLPATLLIPQAITAADLGGDGTSVTSKTYDVVDVDGSTLTATFNSDGTYSVTDAFGSDDGTYTTGTDAPNLVTLTNSADSSERDFLVFLDPGINTVGQTVSIVIAASSIIGGTPADPILEFSSLGIGSVTLQ